MMIFLLISFVFFIALHIVLVFHVKNNAPSLQDSLIFPYLNGMIMFIEGILSYIWIISFSGGK